MKGACYGLECLDVSTLKCFGFLLYLLLSMVRETSTFWLPMQAEMAIFETKLSELLQNQIRRNCGKTANHKVGNICVAYIQFSFSFHAKKSFSIFWPRQNYGEPPSPNWLPKVKKCVTPSPFPQTISSSQWVGEPD